MQRGRKKGEKGIMDLIDRTLIGELVDAHGNVHYEDIMKLPSAQLPSYVAEIEEEYQKAVKAEWIHKPLAKALYEVWKKHDREDVSRHDK